MNLRKPVSPFRAFEIIAFYLFKLNNGNNFETNITDVPMNKGNIYKRK